MTWRSWAGSELLEGLVDLDIALEESPRHIKRAVATASVKSSERSIPFCSAFPEKYSRTLHSMEAGKKTFALGGT